MKLEELKKDEFFKIGSELESRNRTLEKLIWMGYSNILNLLEISRELIKEHEAEVAARVIFRKQSIRKYIIDFREYLENKGLAPLSIEHRMTAVKSFYKS